MEITRSVYMGGPERVLSPGQWVSETITRGQTRGAVEDLEKQVENLSHIVAAMLSVMPVAEAQRLVETVDYQCVRVSA